ncbi:hypothetical protein [Chenggangzhangella methanolivorans]|uniref:Uncharacterized protein n=1 Tax=Chenggangzhangella methanolivorans TaxID=1437009 RepID=A0A9E6RD26_9HYPH|nr:hypothetical protein [Chenggangzhangella methanolivorans]QZO02082.1 hypothetical protein K6K41_12895 [Chenggangzhangella methanolivorans]
MIIVGWLSLKGRRRGRRGQAGQARRQPLPDDPQRPDDDRHREVRAGRAGVLKGVDSGIIADALAKVKEQNPEAVKGLKQDDDKLRTKIIAKLPEVQASVAESAAKVQQAAQ